MNKIEARRNGNGGVDLVTESDGHSVLIMTGDSKNSSDFWGRMIETARLALYEIDKETEVINIDDIDDKVTLDEKLNEEEREFLINGVFSTHLKDDDPKYDNSNRNWLEGMNDAELLEKYYS